MAEHRNLPTWVVLRIAALIAKAMNEWYDYPRSGMIIPMNDITIPSSFYGLGNASVLYPGATPDVQAYLYKCIYVNQR